MRLSGTKTGAVNQYRGLGNQLWDLAGNRPSLDLPFAESKSLVDATTGTNLVDFTRASSGTYVGSDGLIKTATTNEPRFDHDPTTGESLGLLVEESRTNIVTYSEDFTDASYVVGGRLTVTANALAAPNGTVTADKLVATSNNDQKYVNTLLSVTSGFSYAFGMFAKKGEYEVLQLHFGSAQFSGTSAYANFNLNTGSIISSAECTPTIQDIGDGWYRCSVITPAATGTGDNPFRISVYPSGDPGRLSFYTGDDTSGIYIWGAQLEEGSFPTSYIPTEGTTVTRAADVASISGSNFSSWYRQDEGTFFTGWKAFTDIDNAVFMASDNTSTNYNYHWIDGTNFLRFRIRNNSINVFDEQPATALLNSFYRTGFTYSPNNNAVVINGGSVATGPGSSALTLSQLDIGNASFVSKQLNGTISRFTFWPARLPNETLQGITQ